jgi:hypothetical protein
VSIKKSASWAISFRNQSSRYGTGSDTKPFAAPLKAIIRHGIVLNVGSTGATEKDLCWAECFSFHLTSCSSLLVSRWSVNGETILSENTLAHHRTFDNRTPLSYTRADTGILMLSASRYHKENMASSPSHAKLLLRRKRNNGR